MFFTIKRKDDNVDNWFMMGSPLPIVIVVSLYLLFVLKLGPQFMSKRKPFQLNKLLVLYNIFQVGLSIYMFRIGFLYYWKKGLFNEKFCGWRDIKELRFVEETNHIFFMAKCSELLDTIFFVLRKKQSQVTFLHVYHHSFMVLSTWAVLKYDPSEAAGFLATLNSFVHIIMYGYYALSVIPQMAPYLWWKKYITVLQLAQFVAILFQIIIKYHITQCTPSKIISGVIVFNALLFTYLFGQFYINAFIKSKSRRSNSKADLNELSKVNDTIRANLKQNLNQTDSFDETDNFHEADLTNRFKRTILAKQN